jgi:hypothetical protein
VNDPVVLLALEKRQALTTVEPEPWADDDTDDPPDDDWSPI